MQRDVWAVFNAYGLVDDHVLMALPALYRYGQEGKWFGPKLFSVFMLEGVVQVSRATYS
jgi:hypothetical protein